MSILRQLSKSLQIITWKKCLRYNVRLKKKKKRERNLPETYAAKMLHLKIHRYPFLTSGLLKTNELQIFSQNIKYSIDHPERSLESQIKYLQLIICISKDNTTGNMFSWLHFKNRLLQKVSPFCVLAGSLLQYSYHYL